MIGRRRRPSPTRALPPDLRARLERTRLDTLALLRALDAAHLAPRDLPQRPLHDVFALDADCAEALWALDQPAGTVNHGAMLRDTLRALERIAPARDQLRAALRPAARDRLQALEPLVRATLGPGDAYNEVPGRDPNAR
jgi:hypothetical protein